MKNETLNGAEKTAKLSTVKLKYKKEAVAAESTTHHSTRNRPLATGLELKNLTPPLEELTLG